MGRPAIIAIILALFLVASCTPVEQKCEKPFILKDGNCCLDLDEDNACDAEKNATEEKEAEQAKEPEIVVEETKQIEIETKKKEAPKEEPEEEKEEKAAELTEDDIKEFESASIDASGLLQQLMKTYTSDVESYKYNYRGNWHLVRGNSIRIKLKESMNFPGGNISGKHYPVFFVDTVYMNLINKSTTGYCEGNDPDLGKRKCAELGILDIPYNLAYGEFYKKRPDEWLFEVYTLDPAVKTETGYYYLGPRKVKRLEYQDGIKQVIMFYDEKIGLPVKVQTFINEQPSELWLYDFMSANTVKEKHMYHRTAEEISDKEMFYSTSS